MILHIFNIIELDFRIKCFVEFINSFFKDKDHVFIIFSSKNLQNVTEKYLSNFIVFEKYKKNTKKILSLMHEADKIIMHGVYALCYEYIYYMNYPKLFDKTFCILLSGDFYFPHEKEFQAKWFLKNMKNVITFIKEEYKLAQIWYGTDAKLFLSFVYPLNIFTPIEVKKDTQKNINILIGHSARREYNHIEIIKLLEKVKYKDNINIYSPLSYGDGDKAYVNEVIKFGKRIFGNKFIPLNKFLPIKDYKRFLSKIDIAMFGQCQSAAMGNIINLLGFGKKVYLRKDTTFWPFFKRLGVKVFDIENINLKKLNKEVAIRNKNIIKKIFSLQNLVKQWEEIFNS